ncbi:serine protease [Pseudonocardia sp.]|uniref:serine protease n=1 Tax=Pseudonocardia sp. TaxID=60912 RepID=UPI003D109191
MRRAIATLCVLCAFSALVGLAPATDLITRVAAQRAGTIGPGALMITTVGPEVTSSCTAAFVLRNATTTFVAYAAHCAIPVQPQHRTGCEYETLPLGTPVQLRGATGATARGHLAYSSWSTMRTLGETDENRCRFNDFALVAVDPRDTASLDPTVPGLGGPTALRDGAPARFERVLSLQPHNTRPAIKDGSSLGVRGDGWSHRVDLSPSASLGDSGSGMVDGEGRAFGVLATRYLDRSATSGVTDLPHALDYAQRHGDVGEVELLPGRRAFRAPQPVAPDAAAEEIRASGR